MDGLRRPTAVALRRRVHGDLGRQSYGRLRPCPVGQGSQHTFRQFDSDPEVGGASARRGLSMIAHLEGYRALGFSIIPIIPPGDGQDGKHPAMPWKRYQTEHATDAELAAWFATRHVDRHRHRRDQWDRRRRCGFRCRTTLGHGETAIYALAGAHGPRRVSPVLSPSGRNCPEPRQARDRPWKARPRHSG